MLRSVLLFALSCSLAACGSSASSTEPDWQFSASDVDSALTGSWTGTWSAGGKTGSMELQLARVPAPTTKCGSRTLSTDLSPKCIDSTSVTLTGTLTTSEGSFTASKLTGTMMVMGTSFTYGEMNLRTADGKTLFANYQAAGFKDGRVMLSTGEATFTLSRLTR